MCVQFPLPKGLRCDVVLVPVAAKHVQHLIGIELDGVDHEHKPRQYGVSRARAFNKAVHRDSEKQKAVKEKGMSFVRVAISDVVGDWEKELQSKLDVIARDCNNA